MLKNKLMQLFKDNANAAGKSPAMKIDEEEATVYLYEPIGDWYGMSAADFVKNFVGITAGTIHLRVNCPGGDVFDARSIATAIKQSKSKVVAHIDGVCASAATYIALAAAEVEMAEGAFFMIHKGWTFAVGNADEMREVANLLDKVDASIVSDYAKKTGKESEELMQMMADETWMTAAEALENGFIDRIFDGEEVENRWNLSAYSKVPDKAILGSKNAIAKDEPMCYDREKLEKRLSLLEAMGA